MATEEIPFLAGACRVGTAVAPGRGKRRWTEHPHSRAPTPPGSRAPLTLRRLICLGCSAPAALSQPLLFSFLLVPSPGTTPLGSRTLLFSFQAQSLVPPARSRPYPFFSLYLPSPREILLASSPYFRFRFQARSPHPSALSLPLFSSGLAPFDVAEAAPAILAP